MFSNRKVGGIRFIRIGRLQLSFCVCRKRTVIKPAPLPAMRKFSTWVDPDVWVGPRGITVAADRDR